jgi:CBS domain-containing protein
MQPGATVKRVTIVLEHAPGSHISRTATALLEQLRAEGVTRVLVLRALAGIDSAGQLQTMRLAEVVPELPELVVWIDTPDRVARLLPQLQSLVSDGFITVEDTEVVFATATTVPDLPPAVTVGDVMTRDVVTVQPDTPMRELVADLVQRNFGAVPVIDADRRVVGIVTNGDLVHRGGLPIRLDLLRSFDTPALHAQLSQLASVHHRVQEIMTSPVVTVGPAMDVRHAAALMLQRKLKRLPVVDATGRLVGMVSRVDLLHTVRSVATPAPAAARRPTLASGDTPVGQIMNRVVPTVTADMPLPQVVNAVMSTRLNRAVVVDDARHVLGIVTDAEVVERLTPQARPGVLRVLMHRVPFVHGGSEMAELLRHTTGRTARDVMLTDIVIANEHEPVRAVLAAMLTQRKKLVPVVNQANELSGMVDRADLLQVLAAL